MQDIRNRAVLRRQLPSGMATPATPLNRLHHGLVRPMLQESAPLHTRPVRHARLSLPVLWKATASGDAAIPWAVPTEDVQRAGWDLLSDA